MSSPKAPEIGGIEKNGVVYSLWHSVSCYAATLHVSEPHLTKFGHGFCFATNYKFASPAVCAAAWAC